MASTPARRKPTGGRSLATLLESVLTILWVLVWFVVLAFVVIPFFGSENTRFTFPVDVVRGNLREKIGPGGEWSVEATQMVVTTPPDRGAWLASAVAAPFLALIGFAIGQLRAIFRTLREGSPFVPANSRRLRLIGYAILLFEVARAAVTHLLVRPMLEGLEVDGRPLRPSAWPSWETLCVGLAVLVLAEVFRRGTQLQDEQALTV
jgi:hypothetical protein